MTTNDSLPTDPAGCVLALAAAEAEVKALAEVASDLVARGTLAQARVDQLRDWLRELAGATATTRNPRRRKAAPSAE